MRPLTITPEAVCSRCRLAFGEGRHRACRGDGVGVEGLMHLSCYERLRKRLGAALKAEEKAKPPAPAARKYTPRRKMAEPPPDTGPVTLLDAVIAIDAPDAATACRKILWLCGEGLT